MGATLSGLIPALGSLSFAAPWVLLGLLVLPVLYWLLRVTPPAPKRLRFPPVALLARLTTEERVTAHTPWWLLLLRLLIAALVLVALARPLLDADRSAGTDGPMVLVIDDGWAAAADWDARITAAETLIDKAALDERGVVVLTTAAHPEDQPVDPPSVQTAEQAKATLKALQPKPWFTDRAATLARLSQATLPDAVSTVWLHDGLEDPGLTAGEQAGAAEPETAFQALHEALAERGPVALYLGRETAGQPGPAFLIDPPVRSPGGFDVTIRRSTREGTVEAAAPDEAEASEQTAGATTDPSAPSTTAQAETGGDAAEALLWVRMLDSSGRVFVREPVLFDDGAASARLTIAPPAQGDFVPARLDLSENGVEPVTSAGAVALMDDSWRRYPVGLVTRQDDGGVPLLRPLYFAEQALSPFADVRTGSAAQLLDPDQGGLSILVVPDIRPLSAIDLRLLTEWVEAGGTLLRFAGPRSDNALDDLLPVRLRGGDRRLGGAMSWSAPARLAPFPDNSPFNGLSVPEDITVSSQVLAEPGPTLADRTWAQLTDGTPLVTAEDRGQGRVVLFHTSPDPSWTSLPLSVLFPQMLSRLMDVSRGVGQAERTGRPLEPWRGLDGFGRLVPPLDSARPLPPVDQAGGQISPHLPPGFYGSESGARAVNLAPSVPVLKSPASWPGGPPSPLSLLSKETDLMPPVLALALALTLLDLAIALILRGLAPFHRSATPQRAVSTGLVWVLVAAPLAVAILVLPKPSLAQSSGDGATVSGAVLDSALQTRLGFILTGDPLVDETTEAGLIALTEVLDRRTAVELDAPQALDPEHDTLVFHPMIYWPATENPIPLTPRAVDRVNDFLRHGGLLVIDGRDDRDIRPLAADLDIPPLKPASETHVLTRSFYLLSEWPGRVAGNPVWVAAEGGDNDGVSPVIIGANDWAAAWARTAEGTSYRHAVIPGGERQREMAFRTGVNFVMYALTGNYKGDQVHLPAIMERLTN